MGVFRVSRFVNGLSLLILMSLVMSSNSKGYCSVCESKPDGNTMSYQRNYLELGLMVRMSTAYSVHPEAMPLKPSCCPHPGGRWTAKLTWEEYPY
jgi:hypothetical protein